MITTKYNNTPNIVKSLISNNVIKYNNIYNVVKSMAGKFPIPVVATGLENTDGLGLDNTDGTGLENTGT